MRPRAQAPLALSRSLTNPADLWGFPAVLVRNLLDHRPECAQVLARVLAHGGIGVSDFSGDLNAGSSTVCLCCGDPLVTLSTTAFKVELCSVSRSREIVQG